MILIAAGLTSGTHVMTASVPNYIVAGGVAVAIVVQQTALTVGAATLWAEIRGA